jgi:hypothetical protein
MNAPFRFAVRLADENVVHDCESSEDVSIVLEAYRKRHPGTLFTQVSVHEMTPGSTTGAERSVYDFVPQ